MFVITSFNGADDVSMAFMIVTTSIRTIKMICKNSQTFFALFLHHFFVCCFLNCVFVVFCCVVIPNSSNANKSSVLLIFIGC